MGKEEAQQRANDTTTTGAANSYTFQDVNPVDVSIHLDPPSASEAGGSRSQSSFIDDLTGQVADQVATSVCFPLPPLFASAFGRFADSPQVSRDDEPQSARFREHHGKHRRAQAVL